MSRFIQGGVAPTNVQGVTPNNVFGVAINWFANRNPLVARLAKVTDGSPQFQMIGHSYRLRETRTGGAINDTNDTFTLTNVSFLMQGDVLRTHTGEYVEVTANPTISNTTTGEGTVTVRRGVAGTTAANTNDNTVVTLVTNSRTGAEDFPQAVQSPRVSVLQYQQTVQHPYTIGGGVQSNTAFPLVPGASTPLDEYRMDAMQNAMDDIEIAGYFGKAEANSAGIGRAKMGGLQHFLTTNQTLSPSDASAYKPSSFQRDLLTKPRKNGGQPDMVFVASNWMDAFSVWGVNLQLLPAGSTEFGTPINTYYAPFLGGVAIVEASLLPDFHAFAITSREVYWRVKRALTDEPLAKTGDVEKGQMIAELALAIENEHHHAWLQGVTAFAAP